MRSMSTRATFTLSGTSKAFERRTHAVRGDLADFALAGKVFVPHYAQPVPRVLASATALCEKPQGAEICALAAGAGFALLDISGGWAWGYAAQGHVVGYVPLAALAHT
jgi:hypothetical protein